MHGDFSLNPTHYRDRVSRVLHQMGRVQLDSDWNEQTESTLRFLRGLGADVIGPHGGVGQSFQIIPSDDPTKAPFRVSWGHYYIDGIQCVNMPAMDFWDAVGDKDVMQQLGDGVRVTDLPDSYWPKQDDNPNRVQRLLYLAVWERHISAAEDDSIREVALLGPDTASRAVIVWQIRAMTAKPVLDYAKELTTIEPWDPNYLALNLLLRSSARMKARAVINQELEACTISPEARYRGAENRLYRVEIHDLADPANNKAPTFKWSPDNAAIVYPVRARIDGTTVKLESLGRDPRTAIKKNDWVEIVDDEVTLRRKVNPLLQVLDVDRHRMTVTLSGSPVGNIGDDPNLHPILRRWAAPPESVKENQWIELSDGVEVNFSHVNTPKGGYRSGDYWLIPTRTATGDVIWPGPVDNPTAIAPHGIDEHYAPLALWNAPASGTASASFTDLRWRFDWIAKKA